MMSRQRSPTAEFSYSEFSHELERGNVARVEVFDGKRVEGDFKSAVTQDGRSAKSFTVLLPIANSEQFMKRVEDAGVPITAREPKAGFSAVLINLLPWIVMFGLWFFLLRQLQAGGSRAFAFGKSKAKLLTGDTPKLTFADVAGLRRGEDRAAGDHRVPEGSAEVHPAGRTTAQGCAAGWASGHRQDAAGQGGGRRGGTSVLLDVGFRLRRDVRGRRCEPRARPVRAGQGACALHHLHRRNRRRGPAPWRRPGWRSRRARADAQPAAGGNGRLRVERRRHPDRRHQPSRRARPGAAAAGPVRPPDRGRLARRSRPRGDPPGAHAQDSAGRRRRPRDHREGYARHGRRRPRQPGERGGAAGRPEQQDARGHERLRGSEGQGDARRRAEEPRAERGRAEAHRLPRGGSHRSCR